MTGIRRFALLAAALLALGGCGWTQYAGNAGRTGINPLETTLSAQNADRAVVRWQTPPITGDSVVAGGFVFSAGDGMLRAWRLADLGPCSGAPKVCAPTWWSHIPDGATGGPVVLGSSVYVAAAGTSSWRIYAFDTQGRGDCTTVPPSGCLPQWSGSWGSRSGAAFAPLLVAIAGRVLVQTTEPGTLTTQVAAFDAAGTTNCSGGPPTCAPLFLTVPAPGNPNLAPTADAGRLFVMRGEGIDAYDVAGSSGCSAGTCAPLYRLAAGNPGEVAVDRRPGIHHDRRLAARLRRHRDALVLGRAPHLRADLVRDPVRAPQSGSSDRDPGSRPRQRRHRVRRTSRRDRWVLAISRRPVHRPPRALPDRLQHCAGNDVRERARHRHGHAARRREQHAPRPFPSRHADGLRGVDVRHRRIGGLSGISDVVPTRRGARPRDGHDSRRGGASSGRRRRRHRDPHPIGEHVRRRPPLRRR